MSIVCVDVWIRDGMLFFFNEPTEMILSTSNESYSFLRIGATKQSIVWNTPPHAKRTLICKFKSEGLKSKLQDYVIGGVIGAILGALAGMVIK